MSVYHYFYLYISFLLSFYRKPVVSTPSYSDGTRFKYRLWDRVCRGAS